MSFIHRDGQRGISQDSWVFTHQKLIIISPKGEDGHQGGSSSLVSNSQRMFMGPLPGISRWITARGTRLTNPGVNLETSQSL